MPSGLTRGSGSSGTARLWPGATTVATTGAANREWQYSVLSLPRLRCEQLGQ